MYFVPTTGPQSHEHLPVHVNEEFRRVAQGFDQLQIGFVHKVLHAEPVKRSVGLVVYADGTNWNPGSGEGLYVYKSGGWTHIA